MKKRRIISIITIMVFAFVTIIPAFADVSSSTSAQISTKYGLSTGSDSKKEDQNVKITQDKAKKIAIDTLKNYFGVSIDTKKFNVQLNLGETYSIDKPEWNVNFNYNDNRSGINGSVSINSDSGKVARVYYNEYYNDDKLNQALPSITEDQAKDIAEKFLKKIKPEELKQCVLDENYYHNMGYDNYRGYNFLYQRIIDGIEISENNITVGVNGVNGKITSYSINWDDKVGSIDKKNIIDSVKAEELLKHELKFDLSYVSKNREAYYSDNKPDIILAYTPGDLYGYSVDAKTRKILDWRGQEKSQIKKKNLTAEAKKAFESKYKPVSKLNKELNQDEAKKVMGDQIKKLF